MSTPWATSLRALLLTLGPLRGRDPGDCSTAEARRRIVAQKIFLRRIYQEWYATIGSYFPAPGRPVLEVGSGPGFLEESLPTLITSDIIPGPTVRVVLDGQRLPFADQSLHGIVMTNVLHHLGQVQAFLAEAKRCVEPGGLLVMVEPWVTRWSRLVYSKLHYEPFDPAATTWHSLPRGPLSGANEALPWIVFQRDREQFDRQFPQWAVREIRPIMPFRYLLSGGVSSLSLAPGWTFGFFRRLESAMLRWMDDWAMFAVIVLERRCGD